MKLCFLGTDGTFNFHKIGGVDAFVRRLALYLSEKGHKVFLLNYNASHNVDEELVEGKLKIIKRHSLEQALEYLDQHNITKVLCCYLRVKDKFKLRKIKKRLPDIDFSLLLTVYHDNSLKRKIAYLEAATSPVFKNVYCISERILNSISKYSSKSKLLLPPVDDEFFSEQAAQNGKKFRVSYMGRLDKGKGADIVIDYFKNSKLDKNDYEFYIYSYPWKTDTESLAMHTYLKAQDAIAYVESKVKYYSKEVDVNLRKIIDDTSLFLLPYRTLSSTIDSPLVPLEIYSRNKLFLSTDKGIMKTLVSDQSLILETFGHQEIESKIEHVRNNYKALTSTVHQKSTVLSYKTSSIAKILLETI